MYAPVHQERRAAFGAGLYGALGIGPDDHSFYADTVRDELRVDEGKLLVGISFGYADENAPVNQFATDRSALEATTTFDR
jgi:nitroreductase